MLVLACGLLLVHVMLDDFRDLRDAGATVGDLGIYSLVAIPGFLAFTLPIVLLLSTLYVLGKLHKANELTAMRAAGVGFGRLMAPIWLAGFLFCGLSYWLNSYVVPWFTHEWLLRSSISGQQGLRVCGGLHENSLSRSCIIHW